MTIKRYLPSGLKIGGSNLTDKDGCSDILNIEKTRGGEWRRRAGVTTQDSGEGGKGLQEVYGDINTNTNFFDAFNIMTMSQSETFSTTKYSEIIGFDTALKKLVAGSWAAVPTATGFVNTTQKIMSVIPLPNKTHFVPTLDGVWKYDGVSFRKTGSMEDELEKAVGFSNPGELYFALASRNATAPIGSGLTNAGVYTYKFRIRIIDAQNNIFYSPIFDTQTITLGAADDQVMIAPTYGSNFDTIINKYSRKAVINGDQSFTGNVQSIVATVDSGHGLVVGDVIPLTATNSLDINRFDILCKVTAIAATTVTLKVPQIDSVNGYPEIVLYDDNWISSGVSLEISRNGNAGSVFYILAYVPLKIISNKGYYPLTYVAPDAGYSVGAMLYDGYSDAQLAIPGIVLSSFQDVNLSSFNPPSKFGCLHQDSVLVSGDPENPNTIYFSNPGSYESWEENDGTNPTSINAFNVGDSFTGDITGIGSADGALLVFCERASFIVSGVIALLNFSVVRIDTNNNGCSSHATVKQIGRYIYWLDDHGINRASSGSSPEEISIDIRPLIRNPLNTLNLDWASATVDEHRNHYLLSVPSLNGSDQSINSYTLAYNYFFEEWFIWSTDFSGGIAVLDDIVYGQSRAATAKTYKMINGQFQDDGVNMNCYVVPNWEDSNAPSLRKKYNRVRLYSTPRYAPENPYAPNFDLTLSHDLQWLSSSNSDKEESFTAIKRFIDIGIASNSSEAIRLKFSNAKNQDFLISGFDLESTESTRELKE